MRMLITTTILAGMIAAPLSAQPPVTVQPPISSARPAPPAITHAQSGMMEMEFGPTTMLRMREVLRLTDSQVTRLRTIEDSANLSVRPHMTKHTEGMHAASALLDAATPDLTAYDAGVRAASEHMVLGHSALARIELQAREVLTPEQRTQLASARKTAHDAKDAMKRGPMKDEPKKDLVPPTIPPRH